MRLSMHYLSSKQRNQCKQRLRWKRWKQCRQWQQPKQCGVSSLWAVLVFFSSVCLFFGFFFIYLPPPPLSLSAYPPSSQLVTTTVFSLGPDPPAPTASRMWYIQCHNSRYDGINIQYQTQLDIFYKKKCLDSIRQCVPHSFQMEIFNDGIV